MTSFTVSPPKYFEVGGSGGSGQTCKLKSITSAGIVGNNRTVVAAITGKIIRVMGFIVCPTVNNFALGNIPYITLKDGSGGTGLILYGVANGLGGSLGLPVVDSGYAETTVSTGLFMDIAIYDVYYTVFYIDYTPT